ncbi:hypothetical protein D3C80_345690 [compost metagenome]
MPSGWSALTTTSTSATRLSCSTGAATTLRLAKSASACSGAQSGQLLRAAQNGCVAQRCSSA